MTPQIKSLGEKVHNHKGFSAEMCTRCGWVMGSPPLNCQNDDSPHLFPSEMVLWEAIVRLESALTAIAEGSWNQEGQHLSVRQFANIVLTTKS